MTTNIPLVQDYTGDIALRSDPENFPANAEDQYSYLALFSIDWNVTITAMNTAIGETNGYAVSASTSASNAESSAGESATSAAISQSNANFDGKWSTKTGAKTVPYSVNDDTGDGNNYQLLENIADITASQPSLSPLQWKLIVTPALSEPDVKISFNDGIAMERGYGTVDANGNRVVDFTRASTTGNANKSGVSETLAIDEPAITSDGLSVYAETTNLLLHSNDFTDAAWNKGANTVGVSPGLSPDGVNFSTRLTSNQADFFGQTLNVPPNEITSSVFVRYVDTQWVKVRVRGSGVWIDVLNKTIGTTFIDKAKVNDAGNGWCRIEVTNDGTISNGIQVTAVDGDESSATSGGQVDICFAQSEVGTTASPYIETATASVTRAPDVASIPMMNNMPAQGLPFTIVCDCAMPDTGAFATALRQGGTAASSGFTLDRISTGFVRFTVSNGVALNQISVTGVDELVHRFIAVYDGSGVLLYIDGILKGAVAQAVTVYDIYELIYIGSNSVTSHLNSEIKNFEIFHKALSSEEIAARGGPK